MCILPSWVICLFANSLVSFVCLYFLFLLTSNVSLVLLLLFVLFSFFLRVNNRKVLNSFKEESL